MKVYRTPVNVPRTGHELVTCHYPLRIDTYSGCYHNCEYCYAKSMLADRNLWSPEEVRIADLDEIKKKINRCLENREIGVVARAVQNRIPARLGGLTDCFQPIEKHKKVTLQLIKYLNSIDYPYLIVTKSDLIAESTYLREIRRDLAYVQVTVTTLNEKIARQLEPNAPPPEKRVYALRELVNAGIYCAGRISPIIPNVTDGGCLEVIDTLEQIGVSHIIFEFFRGNERMIKRVQDASGKKVSPLQKRGTYYRFRFQEKDVFYQTVAQRMEGSRAFFTFCSDGDPVPFYLHSTRNCCGADGIKGSIPNTKFNLGNQKVASNVYFELLKKKTVAIGDFDCYLSLSDDIFCQFWNSGSFANYIGNCKWDKETNTYRID